MKWMKKTIQWIYLNQIKNNCIIVIPFINEMERTEEEEEVALHIVRTLVNAKPEKFIDAVEEVIDVLHIFRNYVINQDQKKSWNCCNRQ